MMLSRTMRSLWRRIRHLESRLIKARAERDHAAIASLETTIDELFESMAVAKRDHEAALVSHA